MPDNGLTLDDVLATINIISAPMAGIDNRVGSLQMGKDSDPFEYPFLRIGAIGDGALVSDTPQLASLRKKV